MKSDQRIVYSVNCSWWDSIDKVGLLKSSSGTGSLPCCPFCKSVLFEVDNMQAWMRNVPEFEKTHPGYKEFLLWVRGKCRPTFKDALNEYQKIYGKVDWTL